MKIKNIDNLIYTEIIKTSHLLGRIIKTRGWSHIENNQEDIGVWIGHSSQAVVLLLSSGVPKRKRHVLLVILDHRSIVIENSRHIFWRKFVSGVTTIKKWPDENARLSHCSVSNSHTLDIDFIFHYIYKINVIRIYMPIASK